MNFFLTLLIFYSFLFSCPVKSLQVSSKLDFDHKGTFDGEPRVEHRRVKTPPIPLRVGQKDSEEDNIKPLSIVCVSNECKRESKNTLVRNVRKPEVVVQVITDAENKNSSDENSVDVPDVPVIVGTKGGSYYPDLPRRELSQRPQIAEKVYIPLFGSSVIEAPMTTRSYRSTVEGLKYPYYNNYNSPVYQYTPHSHLSNTYPSQTFGNVNRERFLGNGNFPRVEETLICTCQDGPNHDHQYPVKNWNNFIHHPPVYNPPRYKPVNPITWNSFVSSNPTTLQPRWNHFPKRPGVDNKLLPLD